MSEVHTGVQYVGKVHKCELPLPPDIQRSKRVIHQTASFRMIDKPIRGDFAVQHIEHLRILTNTLYSIVKHKNFSSSTHALQLYFWTETYSYSPCAHS